MKAKLLLLLALTLLCFSFVHGATLSFSFTTVRLVSGNALLAKADLDNKREDVFYGKTKTVNGIDYLAYEFQADGSLTPAPKKDDVVMTQLQFEQSLPKFEVSSDFSELLGSSSNCRSPGSLIFGEVTAFPQFTPDNTGIFPTPFTNLRFTILMAKELFCTWKVTTFSGLAGTSTVPSGSQVDIRASTFSSLKVTILPFVPSAAGAPTGGRSSTRAAFTAVKEREVVWDVIFSHPVAKPAVDTLHQFLKYTFQNHLCCNDATCANPTANKCSSADPTSLTRTVVVNNQQTTQTYVPNSYFRFRYFARFALQAPNPIIGNQKTIELAGNAAIAVTTIKVETNTALGNLARPTVAEFNGNNFASYTIVIQTLSLVSITVPTRTLTEPISTFTVVFDFPVTFFRYGREFTIIPTIQAQMNEFSTRYNVSSSSNDGKTWTVRVSPSIYSPDDYRFGVVTACLQDCANSLFNVPYDTIVPIPNKLTNVPGGIVTLTGTGLPAGTEVKGVTFLKSANCPRPFFSCPNVNQCNFPTETRCTCNINACQNVNQVCTLSGISGANTRLNLNSDALCANRQTIITDTGKLISAILRQDTQPESDSVDNFVRIFPFRCVDGQNPANCAMNRNLRELWDRAPALLTNQVYLVNRLLRFRIAVPGLRFKVYSLMCTEKGSNIDNDPALNKHLSMFVLTPAIQKDEIAFSAVGVIVDGAIPAGQDRHEIEFYNFQPSKCVEKVNAPVIIALEWNAKRSLESVQKVLVDDRRVVALRDQIQIRPVEIDTHRNNLAMDRQPPEVSRARCSAEGIRVTCSFVLNEPGSVIVVVLPSSAPEPVLPKIVAGQDANGYLSPFSRIRCPVGNQLCTGEVSGLSGSTDYNAWYVAYDAQNEPNIQTKASSVSFTTSSLANTPNSVVVNTNFANFVTIR